MSIIKDGDQEKSSCFIICYSINIQCVKKPRNCKSIWVREWLSKRKQKIVQFNIFEELRLQEDHEAFRKYLRMHTTSYEELL